MGMKLTLVDPPRQFTVGRHAPITLKDCAHVELEPDEQVTFTTPAGGEYDVTRKSWGFYATPSLNGRLQRFGLTATLVKNLEGYYFVLLVEQGKESDFARYVEAEELTVIGHLVP